MLTPVVTPGSEGTRLSVLNSCGEALSFQVKGEKLDYIGQEELLQSSSPPMLVETTFGDFEDLQRRFGFLQ
jgi:hypothetical protein